jgi:hypothetical protein
MQIGLTDSELRRMQDSADQSAQTCMSEGREAEGRYWKGQVDAIADVRQIRLMTAELEARQASSKIKAGKR